MKRVFILLILAVLFSSVGAAAAMEEPYPGYAYNAWGIAEPSPNVYEPARVVTMGVLGETELLEPEDMVYAQGKLLILDTGNNRVVILDEQYRLIKTLDRFRLPDGEETALNAPTGLYLDHAGRLLIADTEAGRVLVSDLDGRVSQVLTKPEDDIFPDSIAFKPKKVLADKKGNVYVLCTGFYYGAVMYDAQGTFTGFFGSNPVEISLAQLADRFWRQFMTATQRSYLSNYVPVDYASFDIDGEDFIYTCSRADSSMNEIKKLNSLGTNILLTKEAYDPLNKNDYGDKQKIWYNGAYFDTAFVNIAVSDTGLINGLDYTRGRVFQYDQDSNLLAVFGGMSDQQGMFQRPSAVACAGKDVLVLDAAKASVTVFRPTAYGDIVHEATALYSGGYYEEALGSWQALLRLNSNSELAYRGIGRAYLQQEQYARALDYLRLGQDRSAYSKAYSYYRTDLVRRHFALIATSLLVLAALFLFRRRIRRFLGRWFHPRPGPRRLLNPFTVLAHPLDGMETVRMMAGSRQVLLSLGLMGVLFIVSILERQGTGFIFNLERPEGLNLLLIAAKTFGVYALFIGCSWAVGSLNEGEANLRKLVNVTAYAVFPYTLAILIHTVASNFIVYEEGVLFDWFVTFALAYAGFLLFLGIMDAHQYSVGKTLLSLLLTGISMLIVLFVLALLFSLVQQLLIFLMTIYNEILFRM